MNDFALLFLRATTGAFMLIAHSVPKLNLLFSSGEISFPDPLGIGTFPSLILAIFAEFFCSLLLISGFLTRASLIPLIITMIVAAFIHHAADPFALKEKALLFLVIYVFLFITGPGKYALNKIIMVKSQNNFLKFLTE